MCIRDRWSSIQPQCFTKARRGRKTRQRGARAVFHPTPVLHSGTQGQTDHRERGTRPWRGLPTPKASQWHAGAERPHREGHEALEWSSIQPQCFTVARRGRKTTERGARCAGVVFQPECFTGEKRLDRRGHEWSFIPSASQWHAGAERPDREGHDALEWSSDPECFTCTDIYLISTWRVTILKKLITAPTRSAASQYYCPLFSSVPDAIYEKSARNVVSVCIVKNCE